MAKPTLLEAGKIEYPTGVADVAINYIMGRMKPFISGASPISLADCFLVVMAKTSSGKSTILPVYTTHLVNPMLAFDRPPQPEIRINNVLCTQPRVLTAIDIAQDMATSPFYPSMVMGQTIGYNTGLREVRPRSGGLQYVTLASLRVQLLAGMFQQICDKYRVIIIDEAHERSIDFDIVLAFLKRECQRAIDAHVERLPLFIVTSATLDADKYLQYLGLPRETNFIGIGGRQFDIETNWFKQPPMDKLRLGDNIKLSPPVAQLAEDPFYLNIVYTVGKILERGKDDIPTERDVLVFVPQEKMMKALSEMITAQFGDQLPLGHPETEFGDQLPLGHPETEFGDQSRLARDSSGGGVRCMIINRRTISANTSDFRDLKRPIPQRKIIFATTVAETGLTIDTLKYVIDSGFNYQSEFNAQEGVYYMLIKPIERSRIAQRKGRCGRKFPGVFYPIYDEATYNSLRAMQYPDILVEGCQAIMLDFFKLTAPTPEQELLDIRKLDMLDNPPSDILLLALETAILAGFCDRTTTLPFGVAARGIKTRLSPADMRFVVLSACEFSICGADLLSIMAVLKSPLTRFPMLPFAYNVDTLFHQAYALEQYIDASHAPDKVEFCKKHKCRQKELDAALDIRTQILEEMIPLGFRFTHPEKSFWRAKSECEFAHRVEKLILCLHNAYRIYVATAGRVIYPNIRIDEPAEGFFLCAGGLSIKGVPPRKDTILKKSPKPADTGGDENIVYRARAVQTVSLPVALKQDINVIYPEKKVSKMITAEITGIENKLWCYHLI